MQLPKDEVTKLQTIYSLVPIIGRKEAIFSHVLISIAKCIQLFISACSLIPLVVNKCVKNTLILYK